jgi:hypothetical protein
MPKRKEPELTPAEQKKRFEKLAREVGAGQTSEQFKRTLRSSMDLRRKDKSKRKSIK